MLTSLLPPAVFLALFYLMMNPAKVKAKFNLMIAWFIFLGATVVSILMPISAGMTNWINGIQITAMAVVIFFMMLSVDPGAAGAMSGAMGHSAPPQPPTPPAPPPPQV